VSRAFMARGATEGRSRAGLRAAIDEGRARRFSRATRPEASSALDTSHDTISRRRKACRHKGARTASQGDLGGRVAVPSGKGDGSAGLRSLTQPLRGLSVVVAYLVGACASLGSSASLRVVVGMGRSLDPMRG
jgi:hypothetical protein